MKTLKKLSALILALACVLSLASCGAGGNKLTMATNAEFPPFEYIENGEIIGADVEIAEAIAAKLGKELEIRRTLSKSHLYSSAFIVEKQGMNNGVPSAFTLYGAGWGHGVGMCQIGAAVMSSEGYKYDEILLHYYRGAEIEKLY